MLRTLTLPTSPAVLAVAAAGYSARNTPRTVEARAADIAQVATCVQCDPRTARDYLDAEEWNPAQAVYSYRGDNSL